MRPLRPESRLGDALSFGDFIKLATDPAYRDEVAPLLERWFGAVPEDESRTLFRCACADDVTTLFELHTRIQESAELRAELYQRAMTLWRG